MSRPARRFRAALWYKLSERCETLNFGPARVAFWQRPFLRYALAPICLILILGFGTGVYAYNSPAINESHPLYGLKRGLERAEMELARSPEKRAAFNLKQMQRRLAEVERLRAEVKPLEATLTEFNKVQEASFASAENVTSAELRGILIQKITEQGMAHLNRLEKARVSLPKTAQPKMESIIEKQTEVLGEKLRQLQEKQETILEKQLEVYENMEEELNRQQEKINLIREEMEKADLLNNPLPHGSKNGKTDRGRSGEKMK